MALVVQEDLRQLRVRLQVRLWVVVVDRVRRRVRQRARQRKQEVAVIATCSRLRAKRQVQLCHQGEDRHLMRQLRRHRQRRMLVLQWRKLLR